MKLTTLIALGLTAAAGTMATAQSGTTAPAQSKPGVVWGPAPAVFPAGAEMAVLQGDPRNAGGYTVRLRMPDGYKIAPHTHPTDENVTVISGTFRVGMGTTFDKKSTMVLKAGGFVTAPANEAHYASAEGPTVVQVHGLGPFALTYVNPADMPRTSASR